MLLQFATVAVVLVTFYNWQHYQNFATRQTQYIPTPNKSQKWGEAYYYQIFASHNDEPDNQKQSRWHR